MKASEARLLDFLKKSQQFVIPIYQRIYSWTETECRQLWDDILRAGGSDEISGHFIGSIVYIEQGLYHVSSQSPMVVIDGQQRLVTLTLIIEALARQIREEEPIPGFSTRRLRNYYILNPEESGDLRYKLVLTQTDKLTLLSIVDKKALPVEHSLRLVENFEFFEKLVKELGDDLKPLCKGLAKLMIVDISLNRDQDNPQLIFESMNSTGRELSQADLIRNFILMGLEQDHQRLLYEDHWRPMEVSFGQEAYGKHFDKFMRHYLTVKTNEIPNVREVYEAFKAYSRRPQIDSEGVENLVADVHEFATYYCAIALGQEKEPTLAVAFSDLRELKVDVAYPLLLELYRDFAYDQLSAQELEEAVRMIESYVFRRAVCAIPPNSLNKTFATFGKGLKKDCYLESIKAHLQLLPSYRRFPGDDEFCRDLRKRDLYHFRSCRYWLRRLENHGRKEPVPIDEYTIEHIMPQNKNLSIEWQTALGDGWQQVQDTWLHTIGNLTLTGYNTEYSDRPFEEKRDMKGGFHESPIRINESLGQLETWDEKSIQERSNQLAKRAVDLWVAPNLSDQVLDSYRYKEPEKAQSYSIDDYNCLNDDGHTRKLYEVFRKEVLAIDPCVKEEFLKQYIAYKSETNFVDVVPQSKRLRLTLNMKFHELQDHLGLAIDVHNIGHWGNGDVEVKIDKLEDIPYVTGLVRQSFERQMGDQDDEY